MFCKEQFGFSNGMSTIDASFMSTIDAQMVNDLQISYLTKEQLSGVSIYLKKAFDTLNRQFLLCKLERYGIRGLPLALIKIFF